MLSDLSRLNPASDTGVGRLNPTSNPVVLLFLNLMRKATPYLAKHGIRFVCVKVDQVIKTWDLTLYVDNCWRLLSPALHKSSYKWDFCHVCLDLFLS